ncbi:MAG TPA: hypothetical protein VFY76_13525, partial [Nocardioides sp.]|nr:hypothetical protein [Nocardioides sp.]
ALRPRRALPLLGLVAVVAAALGGLLGWVSSQVSAAPAVWLTIAIVAGGAYALTALHARPIVGWALKRTLSSLGSVVSTASRALPLLLVFIAFLFINAEAWQMASRLDFGTLWLTALLLLGLAAVFLLVRLPEEVDQADDAVDDQFLLRACRGTPLEDVCRGMVDDPDADPAAHAEVGGFERWNLIVVLMVIQAVQVMVLVAAVFAFLLLFGSLVVGEEVQQSWTAREYTTNVSFLPSVSAELVKVSLFLASFSGLYFTVSAVTDETYRGQFFAAVMVHLEKAVGVRAVYLALREREPRAAP